MSPVEITSARGQRMFGKLPERVYERSEIMKTIMQAKGEEFDLLRTAIFGAGEQMFIETAGEYGIERWEGILGLVYDATLTLQQRRERAISHHRGFGTATLRAIRLVAQAYENGEVRVIQVVPPRTGAGAGDDPSLVVRFIGTRGVPAKLDDLKKAVRAIVPAHLRITYEFTYLTVGELALWGGTVDQLTAKNLTVEQLKTWKPV